MQKPLLVMAFWALLSFSCAAAPQVPFEKLQGDWAIELTENDIGFVRTQMRFETGEKGFEAFTRKGADKAILGGWTSLLGRTFTKSFKNGSLLRIEEGIFRSADDTVWLAGIFTSALGRYNAEGYVWKDSLFLRIRRGKMVKGSLKGYRKLLPLPMENYPALFEKAVALTESNIYNRAVLQGAEWKDFLVHMRDVTPHLQDDLEMVFAFFYYAGKLPFSHYALLKSPPDTIPETAAPQQVFTEELTPETLYLKIKSFGGTAAEMDDAFGRILAKNYQNLVVDLRDNPGGSIAAGMAFATRLADTPFYGGVFLTQKYFNQHKTLPSVAEYSRFPLFSEANFNLILEGIHREEGLCLKVIPAPKTFRGRVFLLVNGKTASTCEPIVYGFKQQRRATVVGEKTAGAMLNGESFALEKGFEMVVPTADYYAVDGFKIDRNGVAPDVVTKPEEALEYVKKQLLK